MIARWNTEAEAHAAGRKATEGLTHTITYRVMLTYGIGWQVVIVDPDTNADMGFYCPVEEVTEAA